MEAGAQLIFSLWFQSQTPEYGMVSHTFRLTFLSSVKLVLETTSFSQNSHPEVCLPDDSKVKSTWQ